MVLEMLSTACDVFVLPAKLARDGDVDGIPVAIMEAMSMGIPVITTAVGGIPELVVDGVTGVVVDQDSPSAIASALQRMIDDPDWARALGLRGKSHVTRSFNLDDQAGSSPSDRTMSRLCTPADRRGPSQLREPPSRRPMAGTMTGAHRSSSASRLWESTSGRGSVVRMTTSTRAGRFRSVVGIALVWVIAAATILFTAVDTKWGPILFSLSRRHGVHLGDVLVLLGAVTAAGLATWWLLRGRTR